MKIFQFVFFFILTISLFIALNTSIQGVPPLGRLLSPHQGYLQNAEKEALDLPPQLNLEGLQGKVEVRFDDMMVPHISAETDEDLLFAQGYITAYHRLFQMDLTSYKTAGRISELLGPDYLSFDRGQRRTGLTYGAQNVLEEMKKYPEFYAKLQAYSDGVNAYINELRPADYPIEYKLLNFAPEAWSPFKTCLLLREMADQLSRGEADLEYTNALQLWGKQVLDTLYPETPPALDPVIPSGTAFDFDPIQVSRPNITFPLELTGRKIAQPDPRNGSNSFAVNGEKTRDGSTMLANEPDLGLNLPSIWYVVHLNSPGLNVMGASIPGAPLVILGFNDSIAWGFTNAKRDLVDWYRINFKTSKREEYRYDNKWLKTQKVIEEFKVKGGETYYDTLIYTHYGPVTYDRNYPLSDREDANFAMRWTAHDPSPEPMAFYQVARADNHEDFVQAFRSFHGPPQNISFASASGDIGLQITGKFPVKWEEQGKFLMDGADSRMEWKTFMPYDHLYRVLNPDRNFVSSANQHPGDSTYPYYDFDYNWEYYRNRRINDRLRVMSNIDENDMMELQHDNFNYIAFESLPMMLDSLDSASLTGDHRILYEALYEWDFFNEPELDQPTIFEVWWDLLYDMTWDEFQAQEISLTRPSIYNTIHLMKTAPQFRFFDILSTQKVETSGDLIRMSFDAAVDSIANWKASNGEDLSWFRFKNTTIHHMLRIPPFSVSGIRIGGNKHIVNAASKTHGPSWRMVVKLTKDGTEAWGVYPGSQTGNPGNPRYAEMIEPWAQGNYYELAFGNKLSNDRILQTITINSN